MQKEDLDASTMEKLRRHNVNIYDMNNESLRQECLLKSLRRVNEGFEITEDKNDKLMTLKNISPQGDGLYTDTQISETTTTENYFVNKAELRNVMDEIKIKGEISSEPNGNNNTNTNNGVTNIQNGVKITIVESNKEVQSQPPLDSVLNFWSRFTRKSNIDDATDSTTRMTTYTENEVQSTANIDNKGYVHSNEVEYINRIIGEYLASKPATVPTTTPVVKKNQNSMDHSSKNMKALLAKKSGDEEIDPMVALKNMGDVFNLKALSELTGFGGPIRIMNKDTPKKYLSAMPTNMNYNNKEPPQRPEVIQYDSVITFSPKIMANNPDQKMEPLKYLDAILRLNPNANRPNTEIAYTEKATEGYIINRQEAPETWNNNVRYRAGNETTSSNLSQPQSKRKSDQEAVPVDVIQKIAEKVKEIVLKDIRKVTTIAPSTMTTVIATTVLTTTSKPEVPDVSFKNTNNTNQLLATLMELFQDFKTKVTTSEPVKVTFKPETSTHTNMPLVRMLPSAMMGSRLAPIMMGTRFDPIVTGVKADMPNNREMGINPYKQSLEQIPLGPADRALQAANYNVQKKIQKTEYKVPPLTIQTNSAEIAPLAIPLAKPLPLISQQIIVTTPNPFARHKVEQPNQESKQTMDNQYREILGVGNERNRHVEKPAYADLTKRLQKTEDDKKESRETYKDRIQKLKERIKNAHDHNREKSREISHTLNLDHRSNRFVEPSYRIGSDPSVGNYQDPLNQQVNSNRYDSFSRPLNSHHREALDRPYNSHLRDALNGPLDFNHHVNRGHNYNNHENFNRPMEPSLHLALDQQLATNHHGRYNQQIENNHESLNRPGDLNQYVPLDRPADANQRDIITREVLSRLVGSNHHDVISHLVEPSPRDIINAPGDLNQQSRSHHSDAYERIEHERTHPRYKGARFHEELERIESVPGNHYNNQPQTNCCDGVNARQQMPIANVKHRGRFDDTHFRNFLKSQQKVTDMLERILASKTKQERPQSVEIS